MKRPHHAILTGASRGLGQALAIELASRGVDLFLIARNAARLEAAAAEVRRAAPDRKIHVYAADLADKEAIYGIAAAAAASLGSVDAVIHNAADLGPVPLRPLLDTDCESLERALAVNVVGPMRLTKLLLGPMLLHGHGLVAHITSDAATEVYPTWGAYGTSKAALDHMMAIWKAELGDRGVRFTAFDPGEMDTQMHRDALPEADPQTLRRPADAAAELADLLLREGRS